jgi:uncharacterized membrane protein
MEIGQPSGTGPIAATLTLVLWITAAVEHGGDPQLEIPLSATRVHPIERPSSPVGAYARGVVDAVDGTDDENLRGAVEGNAGRLGDVARGAAERLMFFSDAVVAIAITLLAIELPLPEGEGTRAQLASLAANSIAYLTFAISFLVVGAHWQAHHRVFRYIERVDRTFVHLNFAWLMIIVVTPFLTEIIREGDLDIARFGLYALAQALLHIVFGIMQWLARRRDLFVSGTPPEVVGGSWPHQLLGAGGFLVSIPLFPLLGSWAFALWALVPNLPHLVTALGRRKRRSAGA